MSFGGKKATKEELKQINNENNPKIINLYKEYKESSS